MGSRAAFGCRVGGWRAAVVLVAAGALAGCSVPSHYVLGGADGGGNDVQGMDAPSDLGPGPEAGDAGGGSEAGDAGGGSEAGDGMMDAPADGASDGGLPYNWPPAASSAAVVCLLIPSCMPDPSSTQTGAQCVDQFLQLAYGLRFGGVPDFGFFTLFSQIFYCESVSFNCSSLIDCLAASASNAVARCNVDGGSGNSAFCDGNKILYCNDPGPRIGFDCTRWGLTCREIDMGSYTAASCTTGNACDPSTSPPRCDGDAYVSCDSITNLETAVPCSRAFPGTTCQVVATEGGTEARCVPTGPDCAQPNPHCESATTLVECDPLTHREVRTDCSVLFNSQCETAGATAQCGAAGTACDLNSPDMCTAAATASVCVNGTYQRVNCSALGLNFCVSASGPIHCE